MHYLNHINGEEFKGLLKMFLLRFQMKAKHNRFNTFVGSWNASFKTCCPCLKWLGRGASDSADPDFPHRKGTPVRPQPGGNMFKGSPSSLPLESIGPMVSIGRCLIFFPMKLGPCSPDYTESCDILDFAGPAWCIWQSSQELTLC